MYGAFFISVEYIYISALPRDLVKHSPAQNWSHPSLHGFPHVLCYIAPYLAPNHYWFTFCHCRLVLPVLEFPINGIIVFNILLLLLSVIFLRSIHIVAYIQYQWFISFDCWIVFQCIYIMLNISFMCGWFFFLFSFCLLWIKMLWDFVYQTFYESVF